MWRRVTAADTDAGHRLDKFLALSLPDHSRSFFARLIENGSVRINGDVALRCRQPVHPGDRIEIDLPPPPPGGVLPEALPLDIVFEDDWLAVVAKPAGMTVHPGAGQHGGTLANALVHQFSRLSQRDRGRPGIVHRLDRDTSGLLVVAKSERSHHKLAAQFQRREVEKQYLTLVFGAGLQPHGTVNAPIGRHPVHRTRMAVLRAGRSALTRYDVLETFQDFTYLKVRPETGRTHQIRVHLEHIHHPVVGDRVYARGRLQNIRNLEIQAGFRHLKRLFLHAALLRFQHPQTKEPLQFESPLPGELQQLLEFLRDQNRSGR